MTYENLEDSANLYTLLDNPIFAEMSLETILHTIILFTSAEDIHDALSYMIQERESKFYATDVRAKLEVLYKRLLEYEKGEINE